MPDGYNKSNCPEISVVIPVHNEARTLMFLVLQTATELNRLRRSFEIIVVNDNSVDDTKEVLSSLESQVPDLHSLHRHANRGVGNALRDGFRVARGKIVVTMDGDLSHDPREIWRLLIPVTHAHIVCGSRYTLGGHAYMPWSRAIISRMFNEVLCMAAGSDIKDITSGYRAIRREVIESIALVNGQFGIYIEIPLKAIIKGFMLVEVPISYRPRKAGTSKLSYLRQGPEYLRVVIRIFHLLLLYRLRKLR